MKLHTLRIQIFFFYLLIFSCLHSYADPEHTSLITNAQPHRDQSISSDLNGAPPDFKYKDSKAVFIDILQSHAVLKLDEKEKRAVIDAEFIFLQTKVGNPIFDLVAPIESIEVDGKSFSKEELISLEDPDRVSSYRMLNTKLTPGRHKIRVHYQVKDFSGGEWTDDYTTKGNLLFKKKHTEFFMRFTDRKRVDDNGHSNGGRGYLERYFPANLQYDRFPFTLEIEKIGLSKPLKVVANGKIEENESIVKITYPSTYNAAAPFLHAYTDDKETIFTKFLGMNGPIELMIYSDDKKKAKDAVLPLLETMKEAESNFGPYPHSSFIAYLVESGSMEYAGAARTSIESLAHEAFHSWVGRNVMPQNGNASWLDEAITHWRDNGYPRAKALIDYQKEEKTKLTGFSPYLRYTPAGSWQSGSTLMSYLDKAYELEGGLLPKLKKFTTENRGKLITTENFVQFLENESSVDINPYLNHFLYGTN